MATDSNPKPIASITLSSTQAYVEFSNIPQGYAHLYVEYAARTNGSGNVVTQATMNGDTTGANYSYIVHQGQATNTTTSYGDASYSWFGANTNSDHSANAFGISMVTIANYSKTDRFKSWYCVGGPLTNNSTTAYYFNIMGLWESTNAISTLRLTPALGSYVSGSTFNLYGVNNVTTIGTGSLPVTTTP